MFVPGESDTAGEAHPQRRPHATAINERRPTDDLRLESDGGPNARR